MEDKLLISECNNSKFKEIVDELDDSIDELFVTAHQLFETKSGDITPEQSERLDSLKKQMLDLVLEQVNQNL